MDGLLARCLNELLNFLDIFLLHVSDAFNDILSGFTYFLLNDVSGFPASQGTKCGFSETHGLEPIDESREWEEWMSRYLLDMLRILSVSIELIVEQFIDSLSTPSMNDRILSSRLCELKKNVSRFELPESVLEFVLENFVALFLIVDRGNVDILDVVESAPALDGLGFDGFKLPFTIPMSTIRAKNLIVTPKGSFFFCENYFQVNWLLFYLKVSFFRSFKNFSRRRIVKKKKGRNIHSILNSKR